MSVHLYRVYNSIVHMNYTHAFVVNKVNTMKVISIILVSLISVRF